MEDKHPLRRLLHSMGHHRRAFLWASFCSVTNKVFDLAPPVLIGALVDVVVRGEASAMASLGISDPVHQLAGLVIASLIIWGAESAFQYAYDVAWRTIAQTVQHEIRLDAYAHIQDLDMAWFSEQRTGDLLSVLNDDVNQLERFLDHGANDLLQVATTRPRGRSHLLHRVRPNRTGCHRSDSDHPLGVLQVPDKDPTEIRQGAR